MVPNVTQEIMIQLKNLKPGNCIAFGSAFKVPTVMYVDLPNPRPLSNNVDLTKVWYEAAVQQLGTQNVGSQRFIQPLGTPQPMNQMTPAQVQPVPMQQPMAPGMPQQPMNNVNRPQPMNIPPITNPNQGAA